MQGNLPRIESDFNEVYDEDRIWAIVAHEPLLAPIQKDDVVELFDGSVSCAAQVVERRGATIVCRLFRDTWTYSDVDVVDPVFSGPAMSNPRLTGLVESSGGR